MGYTSEKSIQILIALLKANNISKVIASPGTMNISFVGSIQNDPFFTIYSAPDERRRIYSMWVIKRIWGNSCFDMHRCNCIKKLFSGINRGVL